MKRLLPDTNFYGLLAMDSERLKVVGSIKTSRGLVIYGFKIIRDELRDIPKKIKIEGRNLRIDLLNLHDEIIGRHTLEFADTIQKRADDYYKAYREFGGAKTRDHIIKDFLIVSCASLNNPDIVVSNDEKSMLAENAVRAYNLVNSVIGKKTPQFISYEKFKNFLGGKSNEFL
ncbi:hypothetical protein HYY71_01780 [Candidatus Woesearchaeota archaeon]|nr:hypothetical protein [Candidatus Woesearchaeota archaeon]